MRLIETVGDLREALQNIDEDVQLYFFLESDVEPRQQIYLHSKEETEVAFEDALNIVFVE